MSTRLSRITIFWDDQLSRSYGSGSGPTATNGVVGSFYDFFASAPACFLAAKPHSSAVQA